MKTTSTVKKLKLNRKWGCVCSTCECDCRVDQKVRTDKRSKKAPPINDARRRGLYGQLAVPSAADREMKKLFDEDRYRVSFQF